MTEKYFWFDEDHADVRFEILKVSPEDFKKMDPSIIGCPVVWCMFGDVPHFWPEPLPEIIVVGGLYP